MCLQLHCKRVRMHACSHVSALGGLLLVAHVQQTGLMQTHRRRLVREWGTILCDLPLPGVE